MGKLGYFEQVHKIRINLDKDSNDVHHGLLLNEDSNNHPDYPS